MRKKTRNFIATDSEGKEYKIFIYIDYYKANSFDKPNDVVQGPKTLETSDGRKVNRIEKGKYQIVPTGTILLSKSPDAL